MLEIQRLAVIDHEAVRRERQKLAVTRATKEE